MTFVKFQGKLWLTLLIVSIVLMMDNIVLLAQPNSKITVENVQKSIKEKKILSAYEKKLNWNLYQLLKKIKTSGITRSKLSHYNIVKTFSNALIDIDEKGRLHLLLRTKKINSNLISKLKKLEFEIEATTEKFNVTSNHQMICGWLPFDRVNDVAKFPLIFHIRPTDKPFFFAGDVLTEGDAILQAKTARGEHQIDGSGQTIGVISKGIDHILYSILSHDLPWPFGPDPLLKISGDFILREGDEGTAMLEIIHDVAPKAKLIFSQILPSQTQLDFGWAYLNLLGNEECNIICDNTLFPLEPVYEHGLLAQAIGKAFLEDPYNFVFVPVSAAGNHQFLHYEADFKPFGGLPIHNYEDNDNVVITNKLRTNGCIVVLQWNDQWGYSGNDYNLMIFDQYGNDYSSTNTQDGDDDPYEYSIVPKMNNGFISIQKEWSAENRRFSIYIFPLQKDLPPFFEELQYTNNLGAIYGHAAVENCLAVGAIDANDSGHDDIEAFSSSGPTRIYEFDGINNPINYENLNKPDHVAIDGVQTYVGTQGNFYNPFYGTSAAAAHTAAIAAVVWEKRLAEDPDISAAKVKRIIDCTCDDLGATGFDFVTGYGRVNAKRAVSVDITPPLAPGTPTDEGVNTMSSYVKFLWNKALDSESVIIDYHLQISTRSDCSGDYLFDYWLIGDYPSWDDPDKYIFDGIGEVTDFTIRVQAGNSYYARVRAKNNAELHEDCECWRIGPWSDCSDGIEVLPKPIDLVFCFNLPNTMTGEITSLKNNIKNIIIPAIQSFGDIDVSIASFVDYPGEFNSCNNNYSGQYGASGDLPWELKLPLLPDNSCNPILNIQTEIDNLNCGSGGDLPHDYSRALYETMLLDWYNDAYKFVIMIGDAPVHDCDFINIGGNTIPYGADPGPDNTIDGCTDLNYEKVVEWISKFGLTVISLDYSTASSFTNDPAGHAWNNFEYMAGNTQGSHIKKEDITSIPFSINESIVEQFLTLGGPKSYNLYPITMNAEDMNIIDLQDNGIISEDGRRCWYLHHEDDTILSGVLFLSEGIYTITVTAKPEPWAETEEQNPDPFLKVEVGSVYSSEERDIDLTGWSDYTFTTTIPIPAGFHCVKIIYKHDAYLRGEGDRNLKIEKVMISAL